MADQMIFKRFEIKYMIDEAVFEKLMEVMDGYMIADEHGRSTVCSLYYDTPKHLLIRRSLEHPVYKEKLRLRSYGVAKPSDTVFVELKKKFCSVVYKRRIAMTHDKALSYLAGNGQIAESQIAESQITDSQIASEINYALKIYENLAPAVLLSYEREAFYARNNHEFRVTFDRNILWRDYDLSLDKGIFGTPILEDQKVLMEVKTDGAIPGWMVDFLTANKLYKTSFSKYGTAYRAICDRVNNRSTKPAYGCDESAAVAGSDVYGDEPIAVAGSEVYSDGRIAVAGSEVYSDEPIAVADSEVYSDGRVDIAGN